MTSKTTRVYKRKKKKKNYFTFAKEEKKKLVRILKHSKFIMFFILLNILPRYNQTGLPNP